MSALPDSLLESPPVAREGAVQNIATWGKDGGLNRRIVHALQEKNRIFEEHGYEWQFGREQEFDLTLRHEISPEFIAGKRAGLSRRWKEANPCGVAPKELEGQVKAFEDFGLKELFAAELQLRLKDILMPRFGKKFFDAQPGVLEVSTKPVSPVEDVKQFHELHRVLREQADAYGVTLVYRKRDISFTCIDKTTGTSLFDSRPGHQDPRGLQAADGVLRVAYDAAPVFVRMWKKEYFEDGDQYTIGICRDNKLRWREINKDGLAIMELRDDQNPLAGEHPALENLLILAGIQYGLHCHREPYYRDQMSKAKYSTKRVFTSDHPDTFFTQEILNLSTVGEGGELVFDNDFRLRRDLFKYNRYLKTELGLKEAVPGIGLANFFKGLVLNEKRDGLHIDKEALAAISDDPDLAARNLGRLSFGTEVSRIRNKTGYTVRLNDPETGKACYPGTDDRQRYVHCMAQSEVLQRMLSKTLFRDIVKAYADKLGMDMPDIGKGAAQAR